MKKVSLWLILMLAILMACEKIDSETMAEEEALLVSETQDPYIEAIVKQGFARENIAVMKEGYMVEGDMFFSKTLIREWMREGNARHRRFPSCAPYSSKRFDPLWLYIADPNFPAEWRAAIIAFMQEWNSTNMNTIARFNISGPNRGVTSGSNVVNVIAVYEPNIPGNAYVTGFDGSCNRPPTTLAINLANGVGGAERRKGVIMHEIGHVLGFHHTDQSAGSYISGTCSSDTYSILNHNIWNYPSWSYTTCDIQAIELFYPD